MTGTRDVHEPTTEAAPSTVLPVFDPDFTRDPYPLYERLRTAGGIAYAQLTTGVRAWIVTSYDLGRRLLADGRLSKDSRNAGPAWHDAQPQRRDGTSEPLFRHMLTLDPPDHTRLRALVQQQFTGQRVAALRPRIERIAHGLIDELIARAEVDFVDVFAFPLPVLVICELLGVPADRRDQLRRWSTLLVAADEDETEEALAAAASMRAYFRDLAHLKTREPDGSLYSDLTQRHRAGELTGDELVSMAFLLLVAGHETTVNLLGNGMLALLLDPAQLALLRREPALIPNAVEEFLRFDGPLEVATPRYATEPIELDGVTVRPGDTVFVALAAADRDPRRYPEPDRLDLARGAPGHLAFGHGIHHCLGAPLARLEGAVAFELLLRRLSTIELAVDAGRVEWRPGLIMRGLKSLPLRVGAR